MLPTVNEKGKNVLFMDIGFLDTKGAKKNDKVSYLSLCYQKLVETPAFKSPQVIEYAPASIPPEVWSAGDFFLRMGASLVITKIAHLLWHRSQERNPFSTLWPMFLRSKDSEFESYANALHSAGKIFVLDSVANSQRTQDLLENAKRYVWFTRFTLSEDFAFLSRAVEPTRRGITVDLAAANPALIDKTASKEAVYLTRRPKSFECITKSYGIGAMSKFLDPPEADSARKLMDMFYSLLQLQIALLEKETNPDLFRFHLYNGCPSLRYTQSEQEMTYVCFKQWSVAMVGQLRTIKKTENTEGLWHQLSDKVQEERKDILKIPEKPITVAAACEMVYSTLVDKLEKLKRHKKCKSPVSISEIRDSIEALYRIRGTLDSSSVQNLLSSRTKNRERFTKAFSPLSQRFGI